MNKKKNEILLDLIENNDGYISVQEAKENGIERTYLFSLEEDGYLRKVARGLYLRKGLEVDPFYLIHFTYKKAAFSLRSSAFLQGLLPLEQTLSVNLPAGYMTKGILGAKSRHVGEKEYALGLSLAVSPNGTLVPCYDLERTMIDIIRYQESFSKEELEAALIEGFKKNPYQEKLDSYAKAFHLEAELKLIQKLLA